MRIVMISDTHHTDERLTTLKIPEGDVLIHAGDATFRGAPGETGKFMEWFQRLPHEHKIFVPGNHDFWFTHNVWPVGAGVKTLVNNWYTFKHGGEIFSVLGMSWVKNLPLWAFNETDFGIGQWLERTGGMEFDPQMDILITHIPPYGILDFYKGTHHSHSHGTDIPAGEHLGSQTLRQFIEVKMPPLHVFGHIHEAHGTAHSGWKKEDPWYTTTCVNAAILDDSYEPTFNPVVVDLVNGSATVVEE